MGVGDDLYTGAASFGRMWSFITAIFFTIVAVILIVFGATVYTNKTTRTGYSANVLYTNGPNGICPQNADCILTVEYPGTSSPIDIKYTNTGREYYTGEIVTIYVNDKDPSDITLNKPMSKKTGLLIIVGGLLLAGIAWGWYALTKKYKFLAAGEGGSEVLRMFRI